MDTTPLPLNDSPIQNSTFNTETAPATSILTLFLVAGFPLNITLICLIAHDKKAKTDVLNQHVVNLASVNLCECFVNLPLTITTFVSGQWMYGSEFCYIHGYLLTLCPVVLSLSILFMLWDRMLVIYGHRITLTKIRILIVYAWVHGLCVLVLFAIGYVESVPYPFKCGLESNSTLFKPYTTSLIVINYSNPIAFSIGICGVIVIRTIRTLLRNKMPESEDNSVKSIRLETQISVLSDEEMSSEALSSGHFAGLLFTIFCVLELPYIITILCRQLNEDISMPNSVLITVVTLRYAHVLVLPFLTVLMRKLIWRKVKNFLLCRKSNLVIDGPKNETESEISRISYSVPVLFATTDGLHLHKNGSELDDTLDDSTDTMSMRAVHVTHATKCDVMQSQEFINDDTTSDYDSSSEPFTTSIPVSVTHLESSESKLACIQENPVIVHGTTMYELKQIPVKDVQNESETGNIQTLDSSTPLDSTVSNSNNPGDSEFVAENSQEFCEEKSDNSLNVVEDEVTGMSNLDIGKPVNSGMETIQNPDEKKRKRRRRVSGSTNTGNGNTLTETRKSSSEIENQNIVKLKALKKKLISETRSLADRGTRRISASSVEETPSNDIERNPRKRKKGKRKNKVEETPLPPPRLEPIHKRDSLDAVFTRTLIPNIPHQNDLQNGHLASSDVTPEVRKPLPETRRLSTSETLANSGSSQDLELLKQTKENIVDELVEVKCRRKKLIPPNFQRQVSESCQDLIES